jgi:hypothetical protein
MIKQHDNASSLPDSGAQRTILRILGESVQLFDLLPLFRVVFRAPPEFIAVCF